MPGTPTTLKIKFLAVSTRVAAKSVWAVRLDEVCHPTWHTVVRSRSAGRCAASVGTIGIDR